MSNTSRNIAILPAFGLLLITSLAYLLIAPYTKVEESFTLHASWDILTHGRNISNYDHWEFPGAVKRSFIPPSLLSCIAYPFSKFPEVDAQFAIRLALLLASQLSLQSYAKNIASVYGVAASNYFLLFTATQFHLPFYLSRTLPNFLCLPVVILGLSQLLLTNAPTINANPPTRRLQLGIALLVAVGIIGRSEVAILCGTIVFLDVLLSPSPGRYIVTVLPALLVSSILATVATVTVDTHLWNTPSFPELEAVLFNVRDGRASEWGVQPWNYYILSVPKLLLNPLSIPLIAATVLITFFTSVSLIETIRKLRYILLAPVVYLFGFSLLPHKEWRFIIYIIPLLTTTASISAAYIHHHRSKSLIYRFLHTSLLFSIPATFLISLIMTLISSTNYPGALALEHLHSTHRNLTNATVYLDIPTRMTGATLPLCNHVNWTYTKSENETILASKDYWRDIDFAIIGSLEDVPCRFGKGMEGRGEWEVIWRQRGYDGIIWRTVEVPRTLPLPEGVKVPRALEGVVKRVEGMMGGREVKVPSVKLEDKIYILRHLRQEELLHRSRLWEEEKEKSRAGLGLGKMGEIEGQWRDFY